MKWRGVPCEKTVTPCRIPPVPMVHSIRSDSSDPESVRLDLGFGVLVREIPIRMYVSGLWSVTAEANDPRSTDSPENTK